MDYVKSVEEMALSEPSMETTEVKSDIAEKHQSQDGINTDSPRVRIADKLEPFVTTLERKGSSNKQHAVGDLGKVHSPRPSNHVNAEKHHIDTAAPFQSVKEAVSKFGGTIDCKANRALSLEKHTIAAQEFENTEENQLPDDLERTKKLIEELKLSLEKSQREERQAKEDSKLARRRVEEIEQDIANEAGIAAKSQLEANEARHTAAVSDLESVKEELEALCKEYASMVIERDIAVKEAEEAVAASKEVEKTVEDLTTELIATKESLESAQTSHLEAERQRTGAVTVRDLKSKLDASSSLLLNLKAELATYMQSKLQQQCEDEERQKELEEVNLNIEKATAEVDCLRVACISLESKLEEEKSVVTTIRRREEMASDAVSSLEAELNRTRSEIALVRMKENEAREKMIELPKKLQAGAQEDDQAKSLAQEALIEMHKAKEEVEQAKARASALESRLLAAQEELEAVKASEKLAIAATKELRESESAKSDNDIESSSEVTLSMEEYEQLCKQAEEAKEQAHMRVAAANSQIDIAKESEMRSLKKLEELNQELAARRKSLKTATEKAEKAKEGKLGVEQELREWRADQEQQRKACELNQGVVNLNKDPKANLVKKKGSNNTDLPSNNTGSASTPETKSKKKKKSFFPRVVMFFSKRKTHPAK